LVTDVQVPACNSMFGSILLVIFMYFCFTVLPWSNKKDTYCNQWRLLDTADVSDDNWRFFSTVYDTGLKNGFIVVVVTYFL